MRNQAPLEEVEGSLAGLVVLPDNQQLLAGGSIVAPGNVGGPVFTDVQSVNDREAERTRGLDDAAAHDCHILGMSRLRGLRAGPEAEHHRGGTLASPDLVAITSHLPERFGPQARLDSD